MCVASLAVRSSSMPAPAPREGLQEIALVDADGHRRLRMGLVAFPHRCAGDVPRCCGSGRCCHTQDPGRPTADARLLTRRRALRQAGEPFPARRATSPVLSVGLGASVEWALIRQG